ncbi:MAG: galactose oxidase-like domain-containing protein [Acidimicrobiia bacterium]
MAEGAKARARRGAAAALLVLVWVPLAPGVSAQVGDLAPELVGRWTEPFEEGGAGIPRCTSSADGYITCKPAAANMSALPDGRVLYYNGLEGSENVKGGVGTELAPYSRNAAVRILDLRDGTPRWKVPAEPTGGGANPDIEPDGAGTDDPLGMAGVPGRPGDGLVGSTWGTLGGPEHAPSAGPDDTAANDEEMFCADLAGLPDGRVLIAGGIDWYNEPVAADTNDGDGANVGFVELGGIRNTRVFDPATDSFIQAGHMRHPRWYPTLVPLADGKVLAASGVTKLVKSTQLSSVRRTETFDPATFTWGENYVGPASENTMPFQARLHLMPNNKVLYTGSGQAWAPFGQAADEALWGIQQFFDPAASTWEVVGPAPFGVHRDYPYSILLPLEPPYDSGTVLELGGALGPSPGGVLAVPFATRTTVDRQGRLTNRMAASLHEARWSPTGIPLPDGTVLVTGGARNSHPFMPGTDIPVHSTEIYDPGTDTWTEMAPISRDRPYHYSATLLADGRVLIGGGNPIGAFFGPNKDLGKPFSNNDRDPSFQVYSPPYLFRGPRPVIDGAPAGIAWGQPFSVESRQATAIDSVVLVRVPSQQHVNDSDGRTVKLAFRTSGDDRLEAVAPPDGAIAPPGAYYLFVNRRSAQGPVPSVARIVIVGRTGNTEPALQPFPDDAPGPVGGSATPDEDTSTVRSVNDHRGTQAPR